MRKFCYLVLILCASALGFGAQYSLKVQDRQEGAYAGAVAQAYGSGDLIFVNSINGNDGNDGESNIHPLKTITQALVKAAAGDTIIVNPGGSETVTATLAMDDARVSIVCPAISPDRGFTVSGAGTLSLVTVSAADCRIDGLILAHTGTTSSANCVLTTAAADGLVVENCLFDDSAVVTNYTADGVDIVGACNGVEIRGCTSKDLHRGVNFTMDTSSTCLDPRILDCVFMVGQETAFGVFSTLAGSGAVKGMLIDGCTFLECKGSGAAAATVWDGTDNTNATAGPVSFGAAVDQYLITDCRAYTALASSFDVINAINAGALGDLINCETGEGSGLEDKIDIVDGYFDVPTADASTNTTVRDVVGNKTDAAVGVATTTKTLMAYLKGQLALEIVPTADVTTNTNARDVVGNKSDAAVSTATTTKSLMAYLKGQLALEIAPTADTTYSTYYGMSVGNKSDAAITTASTTNSLVAYVKGLLALNNLPTANASANAGPGDVVGNKTDASVLASTTTKSLMGYTKGLVDQQVAVTADTTYSTYFQHSVGNKADAAVNDVGTEKSLVAYTKGALDILAGTAGITTWKAAAAPADTVSMSEGLRWVSEQQSWRVATKATVAATATNTAIFTVTGCVEARVFGVVSTETARAGGVVVLNVGTALDEDICIGAMTDARMIAGSVVGETDAEADASEEPALRILNATSVRVYLDVACDSGAITWYCMYRPISATGAVAAS
jgi:hypothetical protein